MTVKQKLPEVGEEKTLTELSVLLEIKTTLETSTSQVEKDLNLARKILYASHLSARFTEIGWQFCLILFLTALTGNKSFVLVSTYGLFTGLVVCFFGPIVGGYIDSPKYSRLNVVQLLIVMQNLSVVVATICCFLLLRMVVSINDFSSYAEPKLLAVLLKDFSPPVNGISFCLLIALHIFGAIAKLADQSITVALERDWIVVMSKLASYDLDAHDYEDSVVSKQTSPSAITVGSISVGSDIDNGIIRELKEKTWLTQTNTSMKQIDLLCKVVAPSSAGIFMAFFDGCYNKHIDSSLPHWFHLSYAAAIVGIFNLASLCIEYSCAKSIYDLIPSLSKRIEIKPIHGREGQGVEKGLSDKKSHFMGCGDTRLLKGFSVFFKQPVAFGGLALSLLYLNVLTFGALMTGYLVWTGVNDGTIGTLRGISSVIGLLGTVLFHFSVPSYGLAKTGMWSITFQFCCLTICYASLYVRDFYISLWLLVIGVCLSRVGLWVFDLSITQYMQLEIPEDIRGVIGGVQKSLNSFFDLSTYALGLIFSDPSQFKILVAIGFISVGVSMMLFLCGIYLRRDKFHS